MIEKFESYYHYTHKNNYTFKGHSHSMWEINIILKGELELVCEDRVITLKKDSIIMIEPNIYHRSRVVSNNSVNLIVYHFYTKDIPLLNKPRLYKTNDYLNHIINLLEYECIDSCYRDHLNLSLNNKAKMLLDLFLMKLGENEVNYETVTHDKNAIIYEKAVSYMKNNLHKKVTVNEIAAVCFTSPSKLKMIFSEYSEKGVISYFDMLKLKKAKEYLKEERSIKEISDTLGFSSQAYFSSWFKKLVGIAPIKFVLSERQKKHSIDLFKNNIN